MCGISTCGGEGLSWGAEWMNSIDPFCSCDCKSLLLKRCSCFVFGSTLASDRDVVYGFLVRISQPVRYNAESLISPFASSVSFFLFLFLKGIFDSFLSNLCILPYAYISRSQRAEKFFSPHFPGRESTSHPHALCKEGHSCI